MPRSGVVAACRPLHHGNHGRSGNTLHRRHRRRHLLLGRLRTPPREVERAPLVGDGERPDNGSDVCHRARSRSPWGTGDAGSCFIARASGHPRVDHAHQKRAPSRHLGGAEPHHREPASAPRRARSANARARPKHNAASLRCTKAACRRPAPAASRVLTEPPSVQPRLWPQAAWMLASPPNAASGWRE